MTRDDFIERLEGYLDSEGVTPLPDAVRDRVRAALPTTKQAGPSGPLRFEPMTFHVPAAARYGLVAAVLVAAVAIGASLLGGNVGDTPSPTPSGSAPATATAGAGGPMDLLDSPTAGNLPPGEYVLDLDAYPARIEFTVPEGWWYYWTAATRSAADVHAVLVNSLDTGAANGSAWGLGFTVVDQVRVDPCDPAAGSMDASVTESPETLAAALGTWTEFPVTSVEDVTIGGYAGKRVEITPTDESSCTGGLFTTPAGYRFDMPAASEEPFDNPHQFTFIDVDGSLLVIWTTDHPGTNGWEVDGGASPDPEGHVADQVELQAILDSIELTPR